MKVSKALVIAGLLLCGMPELSRPGAGAAKASSAPRVEVQLLAGRTALVPGKEIELAAKFAIEPGWHIYWRNRGEAGMETSFNWHLPPGFRVGPMRFPVPKRHVDQGDIHTFVLEGQPVILTELAVPQGLTPGEQVTVGVDVDWLVCKDRCYKGGKSLSLSLPVAMVAEKAEPANELTFRMARNELPLPMDQARHLDRLWVAANVEKVKPSAEFEIAVVLEVQDGHHLNSHQPLSQFLIPTDLFHDRADGLLTGRARFPEGHLEPGPVGGGQLSVYRGRTVITLPVTADASLTGEQVRLSGVVTYQACSDRTNQCFRPTAAEWSLTLPIAGLGETVMPANQELFRATGTRPAAGRESGPGERVERVIKDGPGEPSFSTSTTWLGRVQRRLSDLGVVGYLVMALIGGFILNLMPCVLPVVSIKILSFVQQARESRLRVFTLGLAFAAGIQLSFVVLGVLIVMLGQQWGGLFQRPQVVIGLAALVTAFALSLFGVFSLFAPKIVGELGGKVQREGHLSAVGMGLLATLLGTACTAPFLSLVIAIASQQAPAVGMLIFVTAGLGMAVPYVLLAAKPAWLKVVPRPGPWMKTFEHVMGFCLLGTVVWLFNTVNTQLGGEGLLWTLLFLLLVSVGVWFYGKVEYGASRGRKAAGYAATAACILGGWWLCFHGITTIPALVQEQRARRQSLGVDMFAGLDWTKDKFPWIPYTRDRAMEAVKAGKTVFIDYTADWCVNCKANEKGVIDTAAVRQVMQRLGVLPFKADYTSKDPEITADLNKYGRAGVPMYLIIPAHRPDDVILLDEVLTQGTLIRNLEMAGPSTGGVVSSEG